MVRREQSFDPVAILAALERNYVGYVLIGGLAQVLRGADLVTTGVDICPSFARDNLDRLSEAIAELDAQPTSGKVLAVSERVLGTEPVLELLTSAGELKLVGAPAGIPNGYVDLRRAASHEHLGAGVRALVASTSDLAAMASALGRKTDMDRVPVLRRIVELEADRGQTVRQAPEPRKQTASRVARRGQRLSP
jgi:hypothetical protein